MRDFSKSRDYILKSLVSEVFGPEIILEPDGKGIDTSKEIQFTSEESKKISTTRNQF